MAGQCKERRARWLTALARGLKHPRWLYVLPNGDVLVAESDAPVRPDDGKGIGVKVAASYVMKRAGSGTKAKRKPNHVVAGFYPATQAASSGTFFWQGLNSPLGMALVGNSLYVADSDALLRFPIQNGRYRNSSAIHAGRLPCPAAPSEIIGQKVSLQAPMAENSSSASAPTAMPAGNGLGG